MSFVQLNNSLGNIVKAFQNGESTSAKFMAVLSALPAIINIVNVTSQFAETISKK